MKKKTLNTLLLTALLSVAAGAQTTANKGPDRAVGEDGHWVGTWATAPHQPDLGVPGLANQGFENQTVRQIVHTSVEGRQVRVRLSAFGSNGLVIGAAHVALRAAAATILPESDRVLTFGGSPTITIPAGALVLSDPVNLNVPALSDLAISIYTSGPSGPATWHFESRQLSYVSTREISRQAPTCPFCQACQHGFGSPVSKSLRTPGRSPRLVSPSPMVRSLRWMPIIGGRTTLLNGLSPHQGSTRPAYSTSASRAAECSMILSARTLWPASIAMCSRSPASLT